jgi:hypothetical protein
LIFRLELAYKDAVKKDKLYSSVIAMLMGLYYFYRNSPKMRQCLMVTYEALGVTGNRQVPTRVGGTRWLGHLERAVNAYIRAEEAILAQLTDIIEQTKKVSYQQRCQNQLVTGIFYPLRNVK